MAMPVFSLPVRVYFEDTDAAGVVYYANYLRYLERARSDWLRALGFTQQELLAQHIAFVVRSVNIDYLASARLDDVLEVSCAIENLGRANFLCRQEVRRGKAILVTAVVRIVCINLRTHRPRAMPTDIYDLLRPTL